MPGAIGALGMQAAGNAISEGMGIAMQPIKNKQQLKQARRLQDLQLEGDATRLQRNQAAALQMWKDTNYSAQMEELEKAGLNPGLIYGMSGGGGATASVTPGGGGGQAAGVAQESKGGQGMGLMAGQMALLEAQKENIEADTRNKEAENPNIPKTGRKLEVETEQLMQGISNAKIQEQILGFQRDIAKIDANIADQTSEDKMGQIRSMAEHAASAAEMIERDNIIAGETKQEKINQIKAEAYGVVLRNALTQAQTGKTTAETSKVAVEIANMIVNMGVEWAKLGLEGQRVKLQEKLVNFNTSNSQRLYDNILRGVQTVTTAIKPGTTINQGPRETIINNN